MRRALAVAALGGVLTLAGCSSTSTHAGLTEEQARLAAISAAADAREGLLSVGALSRETAPNGEEFWEAVLLDGGGDARICIRLSENATRLLDCRAPEDGDPPPADDGESGNPA